jgi:CheY-specific phosphatase CheX
MTADEMNQMLGDSAAEVLERMFFASLADECESVDVAGEPWISASLVFRGDPPGKFGVRAPRSTGRKVAASFLGLEEDTVTEAQTGEVICELANMVCGSVLSGLESETRFELSHPEVEPTGDGTARATASRVLELEEGPVAVWLELGQSE